MNKLVALGVSLILASSAVNTIPSGIESILGPIIPEETAEEALDDIYVVSKEHLELLATLLMAEAEGETELGKRLVIDTVLNRVDSRMFPNTLEDVVYQPMAFSSIWDERFYDCYVTAENFEIAKQETEGRTNEDVLYFRTGRYSIYGTPLFKEDHHYFSGQ